jgi:rfaE bifunctional protein kinase chain/domain
MTPERLQELVTGFSQQRIAVIGDFFLDKYLDTDPKMLERSVESGQPAHQVVAVRRTPGAAGTIANNLVSLGTARVHTLGAIGDDGEAHDLLKCLQQLGCDTSGLLQNSCLMTPTYLKPRDMTDESLSGEHERYDNKNRSPTPDPVVEAVIEALEAALAEVDAVVVADQVEEDDCGIITARMREVLAKQARQHPDIVFLADSRTHIQFFRNLIIKPNQFEAVGHVNPLPEERVDLDHVKEALPRLRALTGAPVYVTLGERGALVSDPHVAHVPGVRIQGPTDPTGAGDSTCAASTLTLASGGTLAEAALIANLVASLTIQHLAQTGTAAPEQLPDRLELWRSQNEE